jgi:hypothetical protein
MNTNDLERRQERAEAETFIISKTEEGFRISSSLAPANQYVVSGMPDTPTCSCPDFHHHVMDHPEWRCKHLLAVQNHQAKQNHHPDGGDKPGAIAPTTNPAPSSDPSASKKAAARSNGASQMLIKRSVSPDGRIDSLSVEVSLPIGKSSSEDLKQTAENTLKLQSEIMESFLKTNGKAVNGSKPAKPPVDPDAASAVPAQLLSVGGMNTKWGRRLFINVMVNGQTQSKFFGSPNQLAEAMTAAGFSHLAAQIAEGAQLNVPARVTMKPSQDGKYLNVERVFPMQAPVPAGG